MKKQSKRISRRASEATKQRMSEAKKGARNPRYRATVTAETRRKISESLKQYWATIPE